MLDDDVMRLIYLLMVLILPLSALAAYKLNWKKGLLYALIWASIFVGVALFIGVVTG